MAIINTLNTRYQIHFHKVISCMPPSISSTTSNCSSSFKLADSASSYISVFSSLRISTTTLKKYLTQNLLKTLIFVGHRYGLQAPRRGNRKYIGSPTTHPSQISNYFIIRILQGKSSF
jgi:hypothetical protein